MAKSKQRSGITCDAKAAAAIRTAITRRLAEMCALRDKALDWSDPEGVHDMRVASRRLRGVLRDFSPYLRKRRLAPLLSEIKNIADALGLVRDYDVAIIALEQIAENAPAGVSEGIRRFAGFRRAGLAEFRMKLLPVLEPNRLADLQLRFEQRFESGLFATSGKTKTAKAPTYVEIARSVCLARLGEVERLSKSLYKPFDVKPLHEMRIAAKHLRYALELFQDCLQEPAAQTAERVARLQSALGGLHDCDIWIEDFGASAHHVVPTLSFDMKETSIWLMNYFIKERSRHLRKALALWSSWEADKVSTALRRILGSSKVRKVT